jgi:hypothetical protein
MHQGFPAKFPARYFLWPLGLLAALITFLALTAQPPSNAVEPAISTKQADVTEKHLELSVARIIH